MYLLIVDESTGLNRVDLHPFGDGGFRVLLATDPYLAVNMLIDYRDQIGVVAIDGGSFKHALLPVPNTNAYSLVKTFRSLLGPNVPIITMSGSSVGNQLLLEAGCSHELPDKKELLRFVSEMFDSE